MKLLLKRLAALLITVFTTVFIPIVLSVTVLGWWFLLLGFGVLVFLALMIYFALARKNLWFTFVNEGTAKIVVKAGEFAGALIQWKGRTFKYSAEGEQKWIVIKGNEPWHPFGGLRFYGLWPLYDIYIYKFKWSGISEDGKVVSHPVEILDYVLLKDDTYWVQVEKAEDNDLLPLDIELVLTIRVVNPYRALFNVQNWLETLINRIKPIVRDITTQEDYEHWVRNKEAMGAQIYEKAEEPLRDFRNKYGVDIRKIQVKDINPPSEYREKTLAPFLAEMDKRAIVVHAEAERERIQKVFSQIGEFGDLGRLIRTLEASERSPLAASLTIQAIPGLQEILRGVFGKAPEAVTKEDLAELRKVIEELTKKENGGGER